MMPAPPPPDVAALVRAGRWAEVRRAADAGHAPLPAPLALAAALAHRNLGQPARALEVLEAALPGAGDLAPALRLETAEVMLQLGRDPWETLRPLLSRRVPGAQRRAATELLRACWRQLPPAALRRYRRRPLSRPLRRELEAEEAVRTADRALAFSVLRQRDDDAPALTVAQWLKDQPGLPAPARLHAAAALLRRGWWRQADALLGADVAGSREERFQLAWLRGRAAYRLGRYDEAMRRFGHALETATGREERYDTLVQRARIPELALDFRSALETWDRARQVDPHEVEGWDGAVRMRVALGSPEDAVAVFRQAPRVVRQVIGPRLAAALLARHHVPQARAVLDALPTALAPAEALRVAALAAAGDGDAARDAAARLLADRRAGPWRELALELLPPGPPAPPSSVASTADPVELGRVAVSRGLPAARRALARALASDPRWAGLLAGRESAVLPAEGPVAGLISVGLEEIAAALYPDAFPGGSPQALAWSAAHLAAWGNGPAALAAGERLWQAVGDVPAVIVPRRLLRAIVPVELAGGCVTAVRGTGVPASWLAGVIRRESRFDDTARSRAGALGLAQLVPETARRLGADPDETLDGSRALGLAAVELQRLAEVFGPHLAPVAAAYNAGDTVVTSWLHVLGEDVTEPLFAAAVAYGETARYVLAVREGAELCRHLDVPDAGAQGQ